MIATTVAILFSEPYSISAINKFYSVCFINLAQTQYPYP